MLCKKIKKTTQIVCLFTPRYFSFVHSLYTLRIPDGFWWILLRAGQHPPGAAATAAESGMLLSVGLRCAEWGEEGEGERVRVAGRGGGGGGEGESSRCCHSSNQRYFSPLKRAVDPARRQKILQHKKPLQAILLQQCRREKSRPRSQQAPRRCSRSVCHHVTHRFRFSGHRRAPRPQLL